MGKMLRNQILDIYSIGVLAIGRILRAKTRARRYFRKTLGFRLIWHGRSNQTLFRCFHWRPRPAVFSPRNSRPQVEGVFPEKWLQMKAELNWHVSIEEKRIRLLIFLERWYRLQRSWFNG